MAGSDPFPMAPLELRIGSYRLLERLGSGGMSSVFRAVHDRTQLVVAIKILPRSLARNTVLLQRFLNEAKCVESLQHPNIVAIFDRGIDQGRHYLILELVAGGDLQDRVKEGGAMPVDEAIRCVRDAIAGLQHAASLGMIHRDIKPANLIRTSDGRVKVTDLGLALHLRAADERVTRDGTTVGTVDYMAPEQARDSRATSVQSDIYSLGCTMYYLLVGEPPFAGGDIAEKIYRHVHEPPLDVRGGRPEVSPALARVIARMMAKGPAARQAGYEALLADLDAAEADPTSGPEVPLVALFDDEGSDDESLVAVIDDDVTVPDLLPQLDDGISLVAAPLAALLDDSFSLHDPPPSGPVDGPSDVGFPITNADAERSTVDLVPSRLPPSRTAIRRAPATLLTFDEPSVPHRAEGVDREPSVDHSTSTKDRFASLVRDRARVPAIAAVLVLGMVLALAVGWFANSPEVAPIPIVATRPAFPPEPDLRSQPKPLPIDVPSPARSPSAPVPDVSRVPEPGPILVVDPEPIPAPGVAYDPALVGEILPRWALEPIPTRIVGTVVTAARTPPVIDEAHSRGLRRAFEVIGGTIEIADDGPFFEDDFRISGRDRLIRAAPGFRPAIKIDPPRLAFVRGLDAVCRLADSRLIVDGVDLVIDTADLPTRQNALFRCRDSEVVLRRCSITVINQASKDFAIFEVERGERSPRIRIEESLIRIGSGFGFDLRSAPAEVVVRNSVVLCGDGPMVLLPTRLSEPHSGRSRVAVVDSLVVGSGPVVEMDGLAGPILDGMVRSTFQALGTSFVRVASSLGTGSALIHRIDAAGNPNAHLEWFGAGNKYHGWDGLMSAGAGRPLIVMGRDEARRAWPGTDRGSLETDEVGRWPESFPWSVPTELIGLAPDRSGLLACVANPRPYLREKTVASFRSPGPALVPLPSNGPGRAPMELIFQANDEPWKGDLGKFLRDRLPASADAIVRVEVIGSGRYPISPVQIPEGLDLEIEVVTKSLGNGSNPPSWHSSGNLDDEALIEARGGDLHLKGVCLEATLDQRGPLIRVVDGHLTLERCRLASTSRIGVDPYPLLIFSQRECPGRDRAHVGCRLVDCAFLTRGDAIRMEWGQGGVVLENCVFASGRDALTLQPHPIQGSPLDADLEIDHCTILAGRSIVRLLGSGSGSVGPDRPCLVSSRFNAFLTRSTPGRDGLMLLTDADAMSHALLAWQGEGNAYAVDQFASASDSQASTRLDPSLRTDWIDLWGRSHVLDRSGPTLGIVTAGVRLLKDRNPAQVIDIDDMALDPSFHPFRKAFDVGADLDRLRQFGPVDRAPGS